MRKYVVPCVALMGLALLSPRADAANLIIKSRGIAPGGTASLPVSVTLPAGSTLQMWGIDAALALPAGVTLPAETATFVAATDPGTTDVTVSGRTLNTLNGGTQYLYFGYLRGASAMAAGTTDNGNGVPPAAAIGRLRLGVAAGTTLGTVLNLKPPTSYNVENNGTAGDDARPGATGVTSTATANAPVVSEPVTVLDTFPGYAAPTSGNDFRQPLNKIAVGAPGDINANGTVDNTDVTILARTLAGFVATFSEYRAIVGDVAPSGGYTAANPLGTNTQPGGGYGNGRVDNTDATAMARAIAGFSTLPAGD